MRRATRTSAPAKFTDDEQVQIEAAIAAGKVTRIKNGEWDHRSIRQRIEASRQAPVSVMRA